MLARLLAFSTRKEKRSSWFLSVLLRLAALMSANKQRVQDNCLSSYCAFIPVGEVPSSARPMVHREQRVMGESSVRCWSFEEFHCVLNDFAWTKRGINQQLLCQGCSISSSVIKDLNVFNELELALKGNGLRKQKCQISCGIKLQIKRISNFT